MPNVPVYNGRAVGEFKNFTAKIERHFDKCPDWYQYDEHKVVRAVKHVPLPLEEAWNQHTRDMPASEKTYIKFCLFMIAQLQRGTSPESAEFTYNSSYQRASQPLTDLSNWMMQWAPHFWHDDSERDRMRHLFEHLLHRTRIAAYKTYDDFEKYSDFVEYLQHVEDRLPTQAGLPGRNGKPRKRNRD